MQNDSKVSFKAMDEGGPQKTISVRTLIITLQYETSYSVCRFELIPQSCHFCHHAPTPTRHPWP